MRHIIRSIRILAALTLLLIATAAGCEDKKEAPEQDRRSPVEKACANLQEVVDEPQERCLNEMGAFMAQCPEQADATLACMAEAKSEDDLFKCTRKCMLEGADSYGAAVPKAFDTPELQEACVQLLKRQGEPNTPAKMEACRRDLAAEAQKCPRHAIQLFQCYATAKTPEAGALCLLECTEKSLQDKTTKQR